MASLDQDYGGYRQQYGQDVPDNRYHQRRQLSESQQFEDLPHNDLNSSITSSQDNYLPWQEYGASRDHLAGEDTVSAPLSYAASASGGSRARQNDSHGSAPERQEYGNGYGTQEKSYPMGTQNGHKTRRRKWWIIGAVSLLAAAGIATGIAVSRVRSDSSNSASTQSKTPSSSQNSTSSKLQVSPRIIAFCSNSKLLVLILPKDYSWNSWRCIVGPGRSQYIPEGFQVGL